MDGALCPGRQMESQNATLRIVPIAIPASGTPTHTTHIHHMHLLDVVLQAARQAEVNDAADLLCVQAHAERQRGHHHADASGAKARLDRLPVLQKQSAVKIKQIKIK
jgi:hypothetical protein